MRITYGTITPDQLDENAATLDREWNPKNLLERLWQHVRKYRSFAHAGGDEILEAAAVRKTLIILEKSGGFADEASNWRKLPSIEKTWANLQKHFKVANDEQKRLLTTEGAGYHNANATQASIQLEQAMAALTNLIAAANAATDVAPERHNQSATNSSTTACHYCWTHGLGQFKSPKHHYVTC